VDEDGLTPEQLSHVRSLAESGYLPALEKWAKRLSAPFWWDVPEETAGRQRQGGTICFVHTGKRLIGVTAGHIHQEIVDRLATGKSRWCQIGAHTFDPVARLIDLSDAHALDIATYDLSEIQVNAADADIHHAPAWPPEVGPDDIQVVGGWPWSLSEDGVGSHTHQFLHFIARLSSHSDRNLGIVTYTSKSVPWGRNALPPGTNLGGMSGGPVYRLSEKEIVNLTLTGIIYEYDPGFEVAFARPLSVVNEDGSIRHDLSPG
jgi:hypothetical protein